MISRRPSDRSRQVDRRGPRVTPRGKITPVFDSATTAPDDLPRLAGFSRKGRQAVPSFIDRTENALDLATRRRLRRLRKAAQSNTLPPIVVPRSMPFRIYIRTRWISGLIVAASLVGLAILLTNNLFFIHQIEVGGTHYLTPEEIFARSDLVRREGPLHIFWVDPAQVEKKLEEDPAIANATVRVGWPPNMVQISITERQPALIWVQAGKRYWVDVSGHVITLRQDLSSLVQVIVEHPSKDIHLGECPHQGTQDAFVLGDCIDHTTVQGVLQFKALYPNVTEMVYDPVKGLGFHEGGGWVLWFGDGVDITTKMAIYNRIVDDAQANGDRLVEVNVGFPDAPYVSLAPTQ